MLELLGLSKPDRLEARIRELSASDLTDLRYGVVDLAKVTIDRLLHQASLDPVPTVLWNSNSEGALGTIASTMLWADHYLIEDQLLNALMDDQPFLPELAGAIRYLLSNAPLIETGLLVPIPVAAARELAATDIESAITQDLRERKLIRWTRDQVRLVEGPTARQVLFFEARDHDGPEQFFFKAGFLRGTEVPLPGGGGRVLSRLLGPYDPNENYRPWIQQSRRSVALDLLNEMNTDLAIASAFGGRVVARSPFQARLLQRKGALTVTGAQALSWAEVPAILPRDARDLARVIRKHDAVEALRATVRSAIPEAGEFTPEQGALLAAECVQRVQEDVERLRRDIGRDRILHLAEFVIGLLAFGRAPAVTGLLGPAAGLAVNFGHYQINQVARRRSGAYAAMIGGGLVPPRANPDRGDPSAYQQMRINRTTAIRR